MHEILRVAEATLAAAGVASPRHDAYTLAAHLIGTDPLTVRLMLLTDLPTTFHHDYAELISRRAHRDQDRTVPHRRGDAPKAQKPPPYNKIDTRTSGTQETTQHLRRGSAQAHQPEDKQDTHFVQPDSSIYGQTQSLLFLPI